MIMEYYQGNDINQFTVFQEGNINIGKDNSHTKQSLIKRILTTIKNALIKLFNSLKNKVFRAKFKMKYKNKDISFQGLRNMKDKDPTIKDILNTEVDINLDIEKTVKMYEDGISCLNKINEINDLKEAVSMAKPFISKEVRRVSNDFFDTKEGKYKSKCSLDRYITFIDEVENFINEMNKINPQELNDKIFHICTGESSVLESPYIDQILGIASCVSVFLMQFKEFNDYVKNTIIDMTDKFNKRFNNSGIPITIEIPKYVS